MSDVTALGTLVPDIEKRTGSCPTCGGESIEIRWAPRIPLSNATKARLEAERPFLPQRCATCIARAEADEAARVLENRRQLALGQLEVPKLYEHVSLENFDVPEASEHREAPLRALIYARSYVAAWPDVALISVFTGGTGTGKGHLAWSIAKELVEQFGTHCRVVVLSDTIRDLREAWSSGEGLSEAARLKQYRVPDLLVIDEVSRHAFYGQPQQHLYDIVAWREARMKPTILTTNDSGAELADVLGPALSSRAGGAGGVVNFGTRDYRLAKKLRRVK